MMEVRRVVHEMTLGERDTEVFSVRWNMDDTHIAAAMGDGSIQIFSATDGSFLRKLNCRVSEESMPVTGIRWRPVTGTTKTKNVLLCCTSDGGLIHWHASSGKELHRIFLPDNQCLAVDFSLDGTKFAVGCKDMFIRVYDESSKSLVTELAMGVGERLGHSNRIFCVKWVSENMIASAGWDNNILLWDLRTREVARSIFGPHVCGDALDVRGGVLVSGSFNSSNQLEFWSLADGRNVQSVSLQHNEHPCMAYAVQFSKHDQGRTLAVGGSGGNECYFFESDTVRLFSVLGNIPRAVFSIDHANTEPRVAIGCGDGTIRLVQVLKE